MEAIGEGLQEEEEEEEGRIGQCPNLEGGRVCEWTDVEAEKKKVFVFNCGSGPLHKHKGASLLT